MSSKISNSEKFRDFFDVLWNPERSFYDLQHIISENCKLTVFYSDGACLHCDDGKDRILSFLSRMKNNNTSILEYRVVLDNKKDFIQVYYHIQAERIEQMTISSYNLVKKDEEKSTASAYYNEDGNICDLYFELEA